MNGENSASVLPSANESETVNNTSELKTFVYNNIQYDQSVAEAPSSNENNTQAPVYGNYYYASHADPSQQRQANELTYEQSTEPAVALGQRTAQAGLPYGNAPPAYQADYQVYNQQHYQQGQGEMPSSRQPVTEYSPSDVATPVLGSTSAATAPESPPAIIIRSSKVPIVAPRDGPAKNKSNLASGNYESRGSSAPGPLDNPETRAMNFTDNRPSEAHLYNPSMQQQPDVQAETMNTPPAHQWQERREKLPTITPDGALHAEWQMNRPAVVNTAEIQKARQLLFSQRRAAEKKLDRVNKQKESSTPQQMELQQQQQIQQQQQQIQQQQHIQQQQFQQQQIQQQQLIQQQIQQQQIDLEAQHLYRLYQMQQQNHLHSPASDSLSSSSRQFMPSPTSAMSAISSTGSGQHVFPHLHPEAQMQQGQLPPNAGNAMYNLILSPYQQVMIMQAAQQQQNQQQQQQQLQQPTAQPYQPNVSSDFFDKWQQHNKEMYGVALQENTARHNGVIKTRQDRRKRKRQDSVVNVTSDKENESVASSTEPPLVIDESIVQPSNVQAKCDDVSEPKLASSQVQVEEGVIENLGAAQKSTSKGGEPPATDPTPDRNEMWLNNYAMFQEWLKTQQQSVDQNGSGMVQCENPSLPRL